MNVFKIIILIGLGVLGVVLVYYLRKSHTGYEKPKSKEEYFKDKLK